MHTTVDGHHSHRDMDEVAALAQDTAIFLMVLSGIVIVIAIIALAIAF